jgi:acyl-CoA thioester hydrolase
MCAQVRTVWVLIEKASGRPRRVPQQMVALFARSEPSAALGLP